MPGGYMWNQPEELKLIDLYYNSKYKTGQYDSQGFRKFFYNIVKPTCDIATKFIDLDTRDILLTPEMGNDELRVFLMQRRLKQWLKDSDFGVFLNDITQLLPVYGHVVVKKSKEGWSPVPLQSLRHNPAAKGMVSGSFAEVYTMDSQELMDSGWDTKELFERGEEEEYVIYDFFTKTSRGWKREVKGDLWARKIGGAINRSVESEINYQADTKWVGSVTLFTEELKEHTYREIKWENVIGRAMGRGFVEYLKDNQIARNEAENLERKGMAIHSTPLFWSNDPEIEGKNTLTNYPAGTVIKTSGLQPVATEARNLPQFAATRQNWDMNTERKTFTSDITTGASLPSRTPLGVANQQATMAASFFERKREEVGLFLKDLLLEDIIPSFVSDTTKEHTMIFSCTDEESQWLDDAITETLIGEKIHEYVQKTGFWPSKEQKELLRLEVQDKLKGRKNRFLKIPSGFWKNAHYMVDINITGESMDTGVRSQILQLAMQIIGTNPAVVQNPMTKQIFFKFLAMGGINPTEIGLGYESPSDQGQMQPGVAGSMAAPGAVAGQFKVTQQL